MDSLLARVEETGAVPKQRDKAVLAGGAKAGSFWVHCISGRKCGRPPYHPSPGLSSFFEVILVGWHDKLLENELLRKDYEKRTADQSVD